MNMNRVVTPSRNRGCGISGESNPEVIATTIRVLVLVNAITFLIAAALHLGARIPLGFAVLAEPRIAPATIVEGSAGLLLMIAACALFQHKAWGSTAAVTGHVFSILGV
jgi:hypothetical protein